MKKLVTALMLPLASMSIQADVLFTEYVEGGGNNKAIEITNTTDAAINLGDGEYTIELYVNGKTTIQTTQILEGTLAPGASLVFHNGSAEEAFKPAGSTVSGVTSFSGNDVLLLKKGTAVIDSIGKLGEDPGKRVGWVSGDVSTLDKTLRRKNTTADTDPSDSFDPSVGWDAFAKDTSDGLGCSGLAACGDGGTDPVDPVEPIEFGACNDSTATLISAVQGDGSATPLNGADAEVVVEGVVTASYQEKSGLSGFFLQEETTDYDDNAATSEGIFVYHFADKVAKGDVVRLRGFATEYESSTQLNKVTDLTKCGTAELPATVKLTLPAADPTTLEAFEGMLVATDEMLTVTDTYSMVKYGDITLSKGLLYNPTQKHLPGSDEAKALVQTNAKNKILLDDASTTKNPTKFAYLTETKAETLPQVGDTVNGLTGILSGAFNKYRIQPIAPITFIGSNTKNNLDVPAENNLRIASMNVLNYFNGNGSNTPEDAGFPTDRGAYTFADFKRQEAKIVSAISGLNADIVGLMEIENDGYGAESAIQGLVNAINAQAGSETWAFVNPGVDKIGTDVISVGIIYKKDKVTLNEGATVLLASPFDEATKKHRPPVIAEFSNEKGSFTIAVNHFKSKSSSCKDLPLKDGSKDIQDPNGQGNCNGTRTEAAETLGTYINENYTDKPVVLLGDFNAYGSEDPIRKLGDFDFNNLMGTDGFSYHYRGEVGELDHLMVNEKMEGLVTNEGVWHVNSGASKLLDYEYEAIGTNPKYDDFGKPRSPSKLSSGDDANIDIFYRDDAIRSSDHDPAWMDISFEPTPEPTKKSSGGGAFNFLWLGALLMFRRKRSV